MSYDAELSEALTVPRFDLTVGNTPLIKIQRMGDPDGADIFVKMESSNPSGSIRDRQVQETVERAFLAGQVQVGDTAVISGIHDATVSTAFFAASLGLKSHIFASKSSSQRLVPLIERFGAEITWLDEEDGKAVSRLAASWARELPSRWYFDTRRRSAVQESYQAISEEILTALKGEALTGFVTSVTTGATFRFVTERLREIHPMLRVRGVRIAENEFATREELPDTDELSLEQIWACRDEIAKKEGLLLGPKGAAAVQSALEMQKEVDPGHAIVAMSPDSGQRYLGWETKPLFKN